MIIFAKGWSVNKDGPGQRLIFYLKGCNMRCQWCANPEGISSEPQILFYPERCAVETDYMCPFHAVYGMKIDREKCRTCNSHDCIEKWHSPCFESAGTIIHPDEILKCAVESKDFFGSDGGITFGGGEASLQHKELCTTLELLRGNAINTCLETNASSPHFDTLLELADHLICDLKATDNEIHLRYTGLSNRKILENISLAAAHHPDILIRIPLVSGVNDGEEAFESIIEVLKKMNSLRLKSMNKKLKVEILRMHHIGAPKYKAAGMDYKVAGINPPARETVKSYIKKLAAAGIATVNT